MRVRRGRLRPGFQGVSGEGAALPLGSGSGPWGSPEAPGRAVDGAGAASARAGAAAALRCGEPAAGRAAGSCCLQEPRFLSYGRQEVFLEGGRSTWEGQAGLGRRWLMLAWGAASPRPPSPGLCEAGCFTPTSLTLSLNCPDFVYRVSARCPGVQLEEMLRAHAWS